MILTWFIAAAEKPGRSQSQAGKKTENL